MTCGCYKECAADCENKTPDFDIVFLVVPAVVLIALIGNCLQLEALLTRFSAIIFYLKRGQGSFCVNNTYSCCNIQVSSKLHFSRGHLPVYFHSFSAVTTRILACQLSLIIVRTFMDTTIIAKILTSWNPAARKEDPVSAFCSICYS